MSPHRKFSPVCCYHAHLSALTLFPCACHSLCFLCSYSLHTKTQHSLSLVLSDNRCSATSCNKQQVTKSSFRSSKKAIQYTFWFVVPANPAVKTAPIFLSLINEATNKNITWDFTVHSASAPFISDDPSPSKCYSAGSHGDVATVRIDNIPESQMELVSSNPGSIQYQFLNGLGVTAQFIDTMTGLSRHNASTQLYFSQRTGSNPYIQVGVEIIIPSSQATTGGYLLAPTTPSRLTTHSEEVRLMLPTATLTLPQKFEYKKLPDAKVEYWMVENKLGEGVSYAGDQEMLLVVKNLGKSAVSNPTLAV